MSHIVRLLLILLAGYVVVMCVFWWIMTSGGKHTRYEIYASGVTFNGGVAVSSSGDVYFSSPATGNGDIYCLAAEDCTARRVIDSNECEIAPVLSRDGRLLAICREFSMHSDVVVLDLSTGQSRIYEASRGHYESPREFSANGKHLLVFRGVHSGGLAMTGEEHLLELATGSYTPLSTDACFGPENSLWALRHRSDSHSWVVACDERGELTRWVTPGDNVYTVDSERRDLVVRRGTKWVFVSDGQEKEIPVETRWLAAVRVGDELVWCDDRDAGLFFWNPSTNELSIRTLPEDANLKIDQVLVRESTMILLVEEYPHHLLYRFDPETGELTARVSTADAVSRCED